MRKREKQNLFKICLLSILLICSQVICGQKITRRFPAESLIERLNTLHSAYGCKITYDSKQLAGVRVSAYNAGANTVEQVLEATLQGSKFSFKNLGNNLYIISEKTVTKKNEEPAKKMKRVSGIVKDENGEVVAGANVTVKGSDIGVFADLKGQYELNVPDDAVIHVSFIGYDGMDVKVESNPVVNVILRNNNKTLNEVVVTALGIKREQKALGYAVQQVDGESLTTVKGINVGTSLTGRISGVLVKNSTEFAEDPTIMVRGESAIIVIDGVPYNNMTLNNIPPDDIENIEVLKGATASALYGSRGSGGAIMVTTKKGSKNKEKGLIIGVNSGTMFSAGFLAIPKMQSTYGRPINKQSNTIQGTGAWGPALEGQDVIQWNPETKTYESMPFLARGKDNFKNYLEQGYILNNNVNITQQWDKGSVRSSATWISNKGQYPNSTLNKLNYTLAGNIDLDKFSLSSSISYNKEMSPNIGFNGYTGYDPMYNLLIWSAPDFDVLQYKDYWLVKNESQNNSYTSTNNNPYFDRQERIHSLNKDIFSGHLTLSYKFSPWLKGMIRTGYDSYSNHQIIRISKGSLVSGGNSYVIKNGSTIWGESAKGSYNVGLGRGYSTNNDIMLSGQKSINNFNVNALIGASLVFSSDEGIESKIQGGLSIPGFYSLKASVNNVSVNSTLYQKQVNSLYGQLGVSWKDFIFVDGTIRNDWSSTLSENNRSYMYPSLSGSFVASKFLKELDWLSFWKLRASWASTKTPAGIYDINSVYSITNNAWGNLTSASYPTTIRGNDVKPESSATWEIGTLASILRNRVSIDLTYYQKRMYDFLESASISPASGFYSNYINSREEITRKGVEATMNVTPVVTKNWKWDVTLNWSKYARYYTKLDPEFSEDHTWVKVGKRADAYSIYDFQKDAKGNVIYSNGLPLYSNYLSLAGYSDPDWIWGISSSLKYKKFTLNISMDGRAGGLAQTITEMYMWRSGNHPKSVTPERYADTKEGGVHYVGSGVKVVSGSVSYDTYGNITNDSRQYAPNDVAVTYNSYINTIHKGTAWGGPPSPYDLYSTTFIKLRELSLTYQVPSKVCSLIKAKDISISAIGQNLFLWAKDFKYSDPDGGSDDFSDPSIRYMGFNVNLKF